MRQFIAPAIGAIATFALVGAPAADAKSKFADIRVVTKDGTTLADHRQYTDNVRFRASEDAGCFGESNPSSNKRYKLDDPTVLGALIDASKNDRGLKPLLITDAFVDDFDSFGVCGIGGVEGSSVFGESYWYSAINGAAAQAGPNQIPVENGDNHLWYFATGAEEAISELVLKAPVRVIAGERFTVRVLRIKPNGSKKAAQGVKVTNGLSRTNEKGKTKVILDEGKTDLVASGRRDDVPSAEVAVCAAADLSECPRYRGLKIFGSKNDDEIRGTRGSDKINCGRGQDIVRDAQRRDEIASNCERVRRS